MSIPTTPAMKTIETDKVYNRLDATGEKEKSYCERRQKNSRKISSLMGTPAGGVKPVFRGDSVQVTRCDPRVTSPQSVRLTLSYARALNHRFYVFFSGLKRWTFFQSCGRISGLNFSRQQIRTKRIVNPSNGIPHSGCLPTTTHCPWSGTVEVRPEPSFACRCST